jgi:hypothetical protein
MPLFFSVSAAALPGGGAATRVGQMLQRRAGLTVDVFEGGVGAMDALNWLQSYLQADYFQEAAAFVVMMTVVVRLLWSSTSSLILRVREVLDSPVRLCTIALAGWDDVPGAVQWKCLVVRFGTDAYLMHLASEQERFEGRLRNKVVPVETRNVPLLLGIERHVIGTFKLPVHRRLGTQFKLFFEVPTERIAERIAKSSAFLETSIDKSTRPIRVWVVARQFGHTKSVEGYTNNFWPAI